jgi:hypothetical protein
MDIQTIKTNLVRTIAGKEALLAFEELNLSSTDYGVRLVANFMVRMLTVNLEELRNILKDVEELSNQ